MKIKEILSKLEKDKNYITWKKENSDYFLAHFFKMFDSANEDNIQVGYYSPKKDRITTFIVDKDVCQIQPEAEVFKKPNAVINKLDINKVKLDFEEALKKANEITQQKYPKTLSLKVIAILQDLPEVGTVYNITLITQTLCTINFRINAENGECLLDKMTKLMDMTRVLDKNEKIEDNAEIEE